MNGLPEFQPTLPFKLFCGVLCLLVFVTMALLHDSGDRLNQVIMAVSFIFGLKIIGQSVFELWYGEKDKQ